MERRLVQVIQDRHLVYWKDDDYMLCDTADLRLVFQDDDGGLFVSSELSFDSLSERGVDEYRRFRSDGEPLYTAWDCSMSLDSFNKFLDGMVNVYSDYAASAFKDVVEAMAEGRTEVDDGLRKYLTKVRDHINTILRNGELKIGG